MDQKQKLDPKLKEAYDRVMGTTFTPPQPKPQVTPMQGAMPPIPPTSTATPPKAPPPLQPAGDSAVAQFVSPAPSNKKKIPKSALAIGVIIFFLAYTFFWVTIFKISLPFSKSGTNNSLSGSNTTTNTSVPISPANPTVSTAIPTVAVQPTDTPQPTIAPTLVPTISASESASASNSATPTQGVGTSSAQGL